MEKNSPETSPPPLKPPDGKDGGARPRRPRRNLLIGAAVVVIVLAIVLGVGLGVGLKNGSSHSKSSQGSSSSSSSNPTTQEPSNASPSIPSWRRETEDYILDMDTWDLNAAPTTRVFNFTLSEFEAAPDGVVRTVLGINGQFPGPLMRVNRGDRVLVNVTNHLTNSSAIHWHGIFQKGTNWMDGSPGITQCPIPPGRSFLYNFTVEDQYGTYWYHSHFGTQYTDGIVGPLIIHALEESEARKSYDVDQVVLISDWYHDLSGGLLAEYLASQNENNEPVPDNGLIQGTNFFNCSTLDSDGGYTCQSNSSRATLSVEQNKRYRIRLINTGSFALFQFSVDKHALTVIEADGTPVEPLPIHRLEIAVAQRYSVILHANQTATNYWIRSQMNTWCFATDNPVLDPDVRAVLTYTNTTSTVSSTSIDWSDQLDLVCQDLNATELTPQIPQEAPPADSFYAISVSFEIGAYALDRAFINDTSWTPASNPTLNQAVAALLAGNNSFSKAGVSSAFNSPNQYVINVPNDQVVDLLITNFDDGSHPFHLHGHTFWVMATGTSQYFDYSTYDKLNTTNPLRRDTLTIDLYGWALIRFRSDNPGIWALHCHISWHMEAGLLMQFQARDDIMKTWKLPSDVLELCDSVGQAG